MAQAGPAPGPGRRRRQTALAPGRRRHRRRAARRRPRRPAPRRPCGSSRRASCAARTTGRASRSSACSSTSASSSTYPSNTLPNFTDALVALLPTLEDHACSLGRRGGFITRLREGTWVGHIAEHVALEFQNLAGTDVRHGKTRAAGQVGQYNCIFEYREEAVGLEAGRMAVALVNYLVAPDDPDVLLRLRARDGAAHPAGRAAGVRTVDPGAHRRGGQPRHPVLPARPPLARPVRARRPPAADPGDDDLADLGHRRRRRVGQEPDQPAARLGRAAGPAGGRRRHRGRRGGRGQAARLPVRRQAARRQPRPRRPPGPALGGRPSAPRSTARSPRAGRATSWSRATSRATTTAAWSSAARSRPSPSASRRR